jgi:signal transduction histidine kinase
VPDTACVNLRNLLCTSAFRLTLMYVVLFAVSVMILLGFVYWTTVHYLNDQTDRVIEADIGGLREQYRRMGLVGLRQAVARRSVALDDAERIYLLATPSFASLAGNVTAWPPSSAHRAGWMNLSVADWEQGEGHSEDTIARALAVTLPGGYRLLVGRNLHEREDFYEHTLQVLAAATGLSLILALVGGLVMSNGILRRIDTINRTGRAIMAGHLEQRVPVIGSGDEFDQLATHLNAMLDQIQRLMDGMRQVTDNVAHDLRSPLNRLRSRLELTLLTPHTNEAYRKAIEQTLREADAMLATFNALLSIARVEAGVRREAWDLIDIGALARDVAELYQPLAEERGLRFTQYIEQGLALRGDRQLLAQAIVT